MQVFRKINKQLPQLTTLEFQYVSPKLLQASNLELAVPGTYKSGEPVVMIASFVPTVNVITSKQRPRRLTIKGSDGKEYRFLLKGDLLFSFTFSFSFVLLFFCSFVLFL